MSKTYGKSSGGMGGALLKQSGDLVIGWWDKYRHDFFFRSQTNVIILQVFFVLIILGIFAFVLRDVERSIIASITLSLQEAIVSPGTSGTTDLEGEIETTRELTFAWVMLIMTATTIVFGYVITRLVLYPARHSLEAQKRFISNIAHEIRTPLSVMHTNADVALLDEKLSDDTRAAFQSNIEELDRISEIINNLLSFDSVVRAERMKFRNVDFGEATKRAIAKLDTFISKQDAKINFRQNDYRVVWGNSTALEQVAMNVLKNAVVYSEGKGVISATVEPDYHGFIVLTVQDQGAGIPEKDLEHIFEPFYRGDRSRVRTRATSGLGLTIVNEIVKLHRGKISIESAPKKGTTISISIPCGNDADTTNNHTKKDLDNQSYKAASVDFSLPAQNGNGKS